MTDAAKPFLRWAGSKRRLLPVLRRHWGERSTRYVEPFMGSAALFFAIQPPHALLSDINASLVETFCAVRDHPRAVYNRLLSLPLGERSYYRIRDEDAPRRPLLDRAARFIYLNRFCFNGLYRLNSRGHFNVPYASAKTAQLPEQSVLLKAAEALSTADIQVGDFERTLHGVREGDFVYIDPPYAVQNRRMFRQYGPDSFGVDDLQRLAHALPELDRRGAIFLVSYAMCREALRAFDGWHIRRTCTQRSVAGFSRHRRKAVELLVSNREAM